MANEKRQKSAEISARLSEMLSSAGVTPNAFAQKLGYPRAQTIYDIINGKSAPSYDFFNRFMISEFSEIYNIDWLITGRGGMKNDKKVQKSSEIAQESHKLIPFYDDVSSIGGYNETVADVETSGHVSEWIDAGDWFPEATAAIRHYGESMVEYPSGSILALKRVHDMRLILNGRNYVIETSEFRVTKQLQYHDGDDFIMAYSSNRETYPDGQQIHSPIKIPLETVRCLDMVLGCVLKEYSNGAIPIIKR